MTAAEDEPRPVVSQLSAALWFGEQNLRVFPLSPGSKIPYRGSNGCLDASSNADVIRGWWEYSPDANIGIATGFLVDVVDIDGPAGQASRTAHWCEKGPECETRAMDRRPWGVEDCGHGPGVFGKIDADKIAVVSTPRPGGLHIYLPTTGMSNAAGILPGVDVRGVGGYVCAPPSVVTIGPNPGAYRFLGVPDFDQPGATT